MNVITPNFSPRGQIAAQIIEAVSRAERSISLMMYEFSDGQIANALIAAVDRGIRMRVILDPGNSHLHDTCEPMLIAHNVPTWVDNAHAIMHDKTMVLDNKLVITGSYNYTISAEYRNAESCLFISDPDIAMIFSANFNLHLAHSTIASGQRAGSNSAITPHH